MVLGLGDGAGGGEGRGVGGGGGGDWSNGMDGKKDKVVILTAWQCLILGHILIFGGAFKQEGGGGRGTHIYL